MPTTIRFRNEAKRNLMSLARRYGWRGKTYASAKDFVRSSKSRVLLAAWDAVKAARNVRRTRRQQGR